MVCQNTCLLIYDAFQATMLQVKKEAVFKAFNKGLYHRVSDVYEFYAICRMYFPSDWHSDFIPTQNKNHHHPPKNSNDTRLSKVSNSLATDAAKLFSWLNEPCVSPWILS
jgi:hypothetical protein